MDNTAQEPALFDLSETTGPAPAQIDLGPGSSTVYDDPAYAKDKAEKFALGIGAKPDDVQAQLAAGGEYHLRQAEANRKALQQKTDQKNFVYQAASKLNRPVSAADLDDFRAVATGGNPIDPATVLEESYGAAFSHFMISSAKDPEVPKQTMNMLPDYALDTLDSVGQAVAKREIAGDVIKELGQKSSDLSDQVTIGNLLKGTGQVLLGSVYPPATNYARNTLEGFGLVADHAKVFLPGYRNLKLGGLKLDLGKSLAEQYQQLALMSPSEFKKEFGSVVNKLAADNLPLAIEYANGYQHYSTSDQHLDTVFGYADWLAVGGTAWQLYKYARSFRAVPKDAGPSGSASGGGRRGPRPGGFDQGPSPYDTLGVKPDASEAEIKAAYRKAAKESHPDVNPGQEDRFKDVASAFGILSNKDKKARFDRGDYSEWQQSGAKGVSPKTPPKDQPAPPVPDPTDADAIQYIKDYRQAAKDTTKAANQPRAEDALDQLGDIDSAAAAKAHARMVNKYKDLDPFNDSLPLRDKLVSLFYPHEIGNNPGSLSREQTDRLVAHGTANAAGLLGVVTNNSAPMRMTAEQADVAIELMKKQLSEEYSHANDAILDVDMGGAFRVYTPDDQAINVHTVELRLGQIPSPPAPKPRATPAPTAPRVPPTTGDPFQDAVNKHTSTGGRTLVRDLYDTMKKEGSWTGNLAEFRQKVSDLRKSGALKMSAHEGEIPKQSPEIKKSISVGERKPVNSLADKVGPKPTDYKDLTEYWNKKDHLIREHYGLPFDAHAEGIPNNLLDNPKAVTEYLAASKVASKVADELFRDAAATLKAASKTLTGPVQVNKKRPDKGEVPNLNDIKAHDQERDALSKHFDELAQQEETYGVTLKELAKGLASDYEGKLQAAFRDGTYVNGTLKRLAEAAYQNIADTKAWVDGHHTASLSDLASAFKIDIKPKTKTDVKSANANVPEKILKLLDKPLDDARKHFEAQKNFEVAKPSLTETVGEEGNFASEFRRDIGYGNETHRNRIIDSEFVVKPRSKYTSPVRAHYVEPPKGFEPKTAAKGQLPTTVNYKRAEPTNDEELMSALSELLKNVARTDNHELWTRLSKALDRIEKRNFRNEQNLGIDTREFDTDLLGSPYDKRVPKPASARRLSETEQISFADLEGRTYDYLNSLAKNNKVTLEIKMGKPSATLFKKRDQAAYYGANVYGLSPNQFRVMQQGNGYYISIARVVDETFDAARDAQIGTSNRSNDLLADNLFGAAVQGAKAFAGAMLTPDEYVSTLTRLNRKVATYGPQEMHRMVQLAADNLLELTHQEREDLRSIFIANRDFKYIENEESKGTKVRRGRFNSTFGDLEREFIERFNRMPSERQIAAYFDYVRLYDLDLAMRDMALVRDVGRLGLEKTTIGYHTPREDGSMARKQSKAFSSRQIDKLPVDDPNAENFGVWVYNPHSQSGEFHLRTDLTKDILDDITDKLENHGFKILELGNPLEKPLRKIAETDENINFIVVKDFDKRRYDWSNIPRRPGGHVDYQDGFFIKQPIIRRTDRSGAMRHLYEGDETLLNMTTEASAKKLVPQIEIARKLLRDGRMEELEAHLAKNTPFDLEQFESFFAPRREGEELLPPRFTLTEEFTHTLSGKNTFDMSHYKDRALHYENFVDAIRSRYNLFANNVDKKYLGSRDPDVPAVFEFLKEGKEPAMVLTAPRLIDPFETINSSLSNVIRSKYLNDVKMQSAENFIQEFAPVMKTPLSEMRRNPVHYLHNPDWDSNTDNQPLIMTGKNVRQAALNMIGTQSTLGKALDWAYRKTTNGIYEGLGQSQVDSLTDTLRNSKNPLDIARAMVFHLKLGLFNPIQTIKQGIAVTQAIALEGSPGAAMRAFPMSYAATMMSLTEDPDLIEGILNEVNWTFDRAAFKEAYLELRKTGLYNVGGEYASKDDFFDPKVFQSKVGAFLDKGTMFFKKGERFPRLMSWFMAYERWRAENPGKVMGNADRAQVLDRADLLTNNMSRASNANIQAGSLATTTQFFSYKWRMAEQLLGTRLTKGERSRLLLSQIGLFGIPIGLSSAYVIDHYDDMRKASLEAGYDLSNPVIQTLHEGIISTTLTAITGQEYNVAKSWGPSGLNVVRELFSGETSLLKFMAGASGSVLHDIYKTSHGAYDWVMSFCDPKHEPPTAADLIEFTRNASVVNNAVRSYYIANTGRYITKNETTVVDGLDTTDAFMALFAGLTPNKVNDTFLMIKSNKDQKSAEHYATREAVKYITRSMRAREDNDTPLELSNLRKAKAALEAARIPPSDWDKVLKQAYDGNVPLFEKALKDFIKAAPPEQKDARQDRAQELMKDKY